LRHGFTIRRVGSPAAIACLSSRKGERVGNWGHLRALPFLLPDAGFSRGAWLMITAPSQGLEPKGALARADTPVQFHPTQAMTERIGRMALIATGADILSAPCRLGKSLCGSSYRQSR
jgi:hypothetical protein